MIYYQATGDQGSVMINNGSATKQDIEVQDGLVYNISMLALSDHLPSRTVDPVQIDIGKFVM